MRKSIFDLVAESYNIEDEVTQIDTMTRGEDVLYVSTQYKHYSLCDFVDEYCFKRWEHRGHCVDVEDFLETIDYHGLTDEASTITEAFITIIELFYNFCTLANRKFGDPKLGLQWSGNFYHLKDVLEDNLERFNHTTYEDKKNNRILIVEDKPGVTAVAETITPSLALDVIRYNHRSLRGEIETKNLFCFHLQQIWSPKEQS